jgi:hypothetical protein
MEPYLRRALTQAVRSVEPDYVALTNATGGGTGGASGVGTGESKELFVAFYNTQITLK